MTQDPESIYRKLKAGKTKYNEEIHCPLLLKLMMKKMRLSAFCSEVLISDETFYNWCREHELLRDVYAMSKIFAREAWEKRGEVLKKKTNMPGVISHEFEHWRMIGWSRFGVGSNPRIRLKLTPEANPATHYAELLKQAAEGEFTAGQIKQLMEAVNVGLNTHQVFQLQKEIDQLKSDLAMMQENSDAHNSGTNKGIAQKD